MAQTMKSTGTSSKLAYRMAPVYHAVACTTFFAASSAPTPLYRLYQEHFAFSPLLTTVIFAVYAFSLLVSLLIAGSISDHLGRRPVIFSALVLLMVAMVMFIAASGPGWLIAARIVQGFATGAAASSIGAALVDLDPAKGSVINGIAPLAGMAIGALGTSALVQYAPAPTQLVYVIVLILLVLQAVGIWMLPETAVRRPGILASLKPAVAVPPQARKALLTITPINVAGWILAGFYLSLIPALVAGVTGSKAPLVSGSVVAALTTSGAIAVFLLRNSPAATALSRGLPALALGVVTIVIGVHSAALPILLVGTIIAGAGIGANFLGCIRSIMPLAKPEERAELLSAFYIESYLAFSLPAILAGYLSRMWGLALTADAYAAVLIVLAGTGLLAIRAGSRGGKNAGKPA